jgi:hypothetical protein
MTPDLTKAISDWQEPRGGSAAMPAGGPPSTGLQAGAREVRQTTTKGPEPVAPPPTAAEEARKRLGRLKLNAVKEELRRAELSFLAAKRCLGDAQAREAAGRIADALGRANLAIDNVEKGTAVHPALEALVGISRFDPTTRQADFGRLGGQSVVLVGKAMEACGVDSIAYWGRTLAKLAHLFIATQLGNAA